MKTDSTKTNGTKTTKLTDIERNTIVPADSPDHLTAAEVAQRAVERNTNAMLAFTERQLSKSIVQTQQFIAWDEDGLTPRKRHHKQHARTLRRTLSALNALAIELKSERRYHSRQALVAAVVS